MLQGCSNGVRDVVLDCSSIVNELSYINITKGNRSSAKDKEKEETLERTKELKKYQAELESEDLELDDFISFLYLIDRVY